MSSHVFFKAKSVGIYFPIGSEVRTEEIIQNALTQDKAVGLPLIRAGEMKFYKLYGKIFSVGVMTRGEFGTKEPRTIGGELRHLDLLIVPGVVFDHKGNRIGYGKGYFDKFMVKRDFSFSVGLAYRFQLLDRDLPSTQLDHKVDALVTEDKMIYF